jgi:hypothetical protein
LAITWVSAGAVHDPVTARCQMNYEFATPIHVTAGETVEMQCSWDRSLDPNRPQKYIVFAEGTEDEMCFSTYAIIPNSAS